MNRYEEFLEIGEEKEEGKGNVVIRRFSQMYAERRSQDSGLTIMTSPSSYRTPNPVWSKIISRVLPRGIFVVDKLINGSSSTLSYCGRMFPPFEGLSEESKRTEACVRN